MSTSTERQQVSQDYYRIERVLRWLSDHREEHPPLSQVAEECGLSPTHFQKIFSRWVGISPKRFVQYLTVQHAKGLLEESRSVLHAALETGLSGPGRLHDLFLSCEAVTPGEYKNRGRGMVIRYGLGPSPFGDCLVAWTDRGVCHLGFVDRENPADTLDDLRRRWAAADQTEDQAEAARWLTRIFGAPYPEMGLAIHLKGTNFQIKVWRALLRIPRSHLLSYGDVATLIGRPSASRAVGGAVARNPVAYLIPCHRVIREMGIVGDYRWGSARKRALLGWEQATRSCGGKFVDPGPRQ